ncbi:Proline/betaine transporter [Methylobacterium crusticola]|uniref:Proline/betaine transporter n=1 Tax=Methylobacterium crusticola TaxID=1697972 RepID=A0ABQ4R5Q0_9HYPH|nr:MFS transporter [Methylobacterium crusticola]GJD53033.1 Proline/betaine transporter [Methylobacterium crusticola]
MSGISVPAPAEDQRRKAIVAGVVGNILEWYDFGVYGYFVSTISELFFPASDPLSSLLLTFAVFGVGFVMRPIGSIVFGIYGDRYGRRAALSAVIFLMAFSTLAIGLLPTYGQIGILAPILLVLIRLVQGLSAGGEWGGSTSYLVEFAPEGRRGFVGSWQQVSVAGGFLLGSLSAALVSQILPPADVLAYGWRIPFLLGIVVGLCGAYLRWSLDDTPSFVALEAQGAVSKAPLREAFTTQRKATLTIFGLTLHNTVAYYIPLVYMTNYIRNVGKLTASQAMWIGTACLTVFVILIPIWGAVSDRIGRKPLLLLSSGGYILLSFPLLMMASSGSVALAFLAQLIMIVFLSFFSGPCPAAYSELFPTRVRYTALSVGYNAAVAVFGGFAPFISTWLIQATGSPLAPAYYLVAAALITFLVTLRIRETAFEPLP